MVSQMKHLNSARNHSDRPKCVLAILHKETSTTGRIGTLLAQHGVQVEHIVPNMGHTLPKALELYSGVIVFGGSMSANDDNLPGIRAELDWLPNVLDANIPYLGVCLGAQLMIRVLGGVVTPDPYGRVEIGYYTIDPEPEHNFLTGSMRHFHWHQEGFSLPHGVERTATGALFPNQAYRLKDRPVWGVQFHPEITGAIRQRWVESSAAMLDLPGAQPTDQQAEWEIRAEDSIAVWTEQALQHMGFWNT